MDCKAGIEISFPDRKKASDASVALLSEKSGGERSKISVKSAGSKVIIGIEAQDITALRAAANSVLRLAGAVKEVDAIE